MPLGWGRQGYVVVGGFSHGPFRSSRTPEQVTAFRQAALRNQAMSLRRKLYRKGAEDRKELCVTYAYSTMVGHG